jgi:serine protease AprX
LALCLILLSALPAFARHPKFSADLDDSNGSASVNVIVQYSQTPTQKQFDGVRTRGGHLNRRLGTLRGAAFSVPASALRDLANDPDVTYISPDRPLRATSTTTDFYDQAVNAPYAWSMGLDGSGIGVAVIDSGINVTNDDLETSSRWSTSQNVVYSKSYDTSSTTTDDLYGHGTHVAGIIAGNGSNSDCRDCSITFQGIAPGVSLINLRVLDKNGIATDSEVINAIQAAISLKDRYNIRVINLSLGRPVYESYTQDPLCQAVEQAWQAGIVVVVAAGNEGRNNSASNQGYGTITAPGNDPYVITVGAMKPMGTATRADDLIASYSSKGPTLYDHVVKPDIVAPGNKVISLLASTSSTLYTQYPGNAIAQSYYEDDSYQWSHNNYNNNSTPSYYMLSGTSMATPVVSGTVALMLQQNPQLTPDQVKARLMKTAYKTFPRYSSYTDPSTHLTYTDQYDIFTIGAGYLDIQAALSNNDPAPAAVGKAMSPTVALDASGNLRLVTNSSVLWGDSVLWGTSVVWGTSVLSGTKVAGTSICWGSSLDQTVGIESILWGNSVLWGNSTQATSEGQSVAILGDN